MDIAALRWYKRQGRLREPENWYLGILLIDCLRGGGKNRRKLLCEIQTKKKPRVKGEKSISSI